jgi:hypothetical protein
MARNNIILTKYSPPSPFLCIAMAVIVTMSLAGVLYAKGKAGIDLQATRRVR